jgi:hypothetical protein
VGSPSGGPQPLVRSRISGERTNFWPDGLGSFVAGAGYSGRLTGSPILRGASGLNYFQRRLLRGAENILRGGIADVPLVKVALDDSRLPLSAA